MLAKARIINYDHKCSFIVLATVITIVNYDRHLFIVQATELVFCISTIKTAGSFKKNTTKSWNKIDKKYLLLKEKERRREIEFLKF